MFLIDTVVLSELRKRERNKNVVRWISEQRSTNLFLSVITIGEIERGIELQKKKNTEFATALTVWLDKVLTLYSERIIAIDLATSRRWGRLSAVAGHDGADLLIAATAMEHGLTVVSRNIQHFEPMGVPVLDPFENKP
ncbi:MAG: type II toxin-antitoxin system VapC family toxin [Proteobacteria bacterium]|nr:type II toxin-antitoxin system VapC family toxin [Pseudomonadota bacterium]